MAQRWGVNGIGIVVDTSAGHAYNCVLTCDGGKFDMGNGRTADGSNRAQVPARIRGAAGHDHIYLKGDTFMTGNEIRALQAKYRNGEPGCSSDELAKFYVR